MAAVNSTLVIVLNSARTQLQMQSVITSITEPRNQCRNLQHLFERLKCGSESASFTLQTSGVLSVPASGTITLTYASVANSDTVTVAGVTLTCVTGTPSGAQFKKVTDGPTTAANLAALINSNATTSTLVYATSASSVVTVTALDTGPVGNFIPLATSNDTGFVLSAATLASGAGGAQTVPLLYNKGR